MSIVMNAVAIAYSITFEIKKWPNIAHWLTGINIGTLWWNMNMLAFNVWLEIYATE